MNLKIRWSVSAVPAWVYMYLYAEGMHLLQLLQEAGKSKSKVLHPVNRDLLAESVL